MPRLPQAVHNGIAKADAARSDWREHPATSAQIALIRKMSLAPEDELPDMKKGYASALIQSAMDRKEQQNSHHASMAPPTEPQKKLITSLAEALGDDPQIHLATLTKAKASGVIDELKRRHQTEVDLELGLYIKDSEVYRVARSDAGWPYVLKLTRSERAEMVSNGVRSHHWVKMQGFLQRLRPEDALTPELAKAYGLANSVCVKCGSYLDPTIKDANGELRWIGPECQKKMGWA